MSGGTADPRFAKGCSCVTHDGPHWLHEDLLDHQRNHALRDRMQASMAAGNYNDAYLAGLGFAREEQQRLSRKSAEMRRRGIASIPLWVVALVSDSHERYLTTRRREMATEVALQKAANDARLVEAATEYETATAAKKSAVQAELAELQQKSRRLSQRMLDLSA